MLAMDFQLVTSYTPHVDQPQAINALMRGKSLGGGDSVGDVQPYEENHQSDKVDNSTLQRKGDRNPEIAQCAYRISQPSDNHDI